MIADEAIRFRFILSVLREAKRAIKIAETHAGSSCRLTMPINGQQVTIRHTASQRTTATNAARSYAKLQAITRTLGLAVRVTLYVTQTLTAAEAVCVSHCSPWHY